MEHVIGIGEYHITDNVEDTIKTYALGTCVALTLYSRRKKVLGMVHIALPEATAHSSGKPPGYYADTVVQLLINTICLGFGCVKGELEARMVGGACSSNTNDIFKIGKRNVEKVKYILQENNLRIVQEETGGNFSRTVEAKVEHGELAIVKQVFFL